jgi:hypothetical protein
LVYRKIFQDSHTARFLFDQLFCGPLLANRTVVHTALSLLGSSLSHCNALHQILVTHHIELVLPGAYYLVRMLDGRIDTHGVVKDLEAQGAIEDIARDLMVQEPQRQTDTFIKGVDEDSDEKLAEETAKKPRKLVSDEHREIGGVKWSIYNTYLKASYVSSSLLLVPPSNMTTL